MENHPQALQQVPELASYAAERGHRTKRQGVRSTEAGCRRSISSGLRTTRSEVERAVDGGYLGHKGWPEGLCHMRNVSWEEEDQR